MKDHDPFYGLYALCPALRDIYNFNQKQKDISLSEVFNPGKNYKQPYVKNNRTQRTQHK